MSVRILSLCSSVSEYDLMQFEALLHLKLPFDYRSFLQRHNGGVPSPATFFIDHTQGEDDIRHFLGICDAKEYSLSHYYEIYLGRIPRNLLPIAPDYFGNLVCLSIDGEDCGKVYFWDHDWEVVEGEPTYVNLHLLSSSFAEFLAGLYDIDSQGIPPGNR